MIFRIILGVYLTFHFLDLLPYAEELFGNQMPYDHTLSPLYGVFPNILNYNINATIFVGVLTLLSILLTLEFMPKLCAFLLWYGWACLFNKNILISNPGLPYVGWILLSLTLVVQDKNNNIFQTNNWFLKYIQHDKLHNRIFYTGFILLSLGYTVSGIHKYFTSPSWSDGTALEHILCSPIANNNIIRDTLLQYPFMLKLMTWLALFLEISFFPIGSMYHMRMWYWIAYFGFNVGILSLINFPDLTFGMLMIHIMTFEMRWVHNFSYYMNSITECMGLFTGRIELFTGCSDRGKVD